MGDVARRGMIGAIETIKPTDLFDLFSSSGLGCRVWGLEFRVLGVEIHSPKRRLPKNNDCILGPRLGTLYHGNCE